MNIGEIHRVYFIGIGGVGMSALARYFMYLNIPVAGYDKTQTPLVTALIDAGALVHFNDDVSSVPMGFLNPKNTLVVYTPAVPELHTEYQYFKKHNYTLQKRSEVLGTVTKDAFCLAVAGTHGKTTTSCILAHLLKEAKMPVTAFLGGISEDFKSNFLITGTEYAVVEADEFDRSFLRLFPSVACVTAMDADHLDIYGNEAALHQAFEAFVGQIKPGGTLFVRKGLPLNGITYGIEDDADFCIRNLKVVHGGYIFDIQTPNQVLRDISFSKPGKHNLLNALVAFAMALQTGASVIALTDALGTFKGVERRFSYQVNTADFVFIDDYAHHPTEIHAVADAVEELYPDKEVVAVFQPHLYSRTRDFVQDFAESLSRFNTVLLLDIYPAREIPIPGVDAAWLLKKITSRVKKLVNKETLLGEIKSLNPEVLITMGAGDIGLEVRKIKNNWGHE